MVTFIGLLLLLVSLPVILIVYVPFELNPYVTLHVIFVVFCLDTESVVSHDNLVSVEFVKLKNAAILPPNVIVTLIELLAVKLSPVDPVSSTVKLMSLLVAVLTLKKVTSAAGEKIVAFGGPKSAPPNPPENLSTNI